MQRYMNPKLHDNDLAHYIGLYLCDTKFAIE